VASGPYNESYGRVVCCDSDHDNLPEILFSTGSTRSWDPFRVEVWEQTRAVGNEFQLVHADTGGTELYSVGIKTGNVVLFAVGDIDEDGLTDVVGFAAELDTTGPDSIFSDAVVIESPDSLSYPCSLSWYCRYGTYHGGPVPVYYPPDLDGDGRREILFAGTYIWENVGNDSNELVWCNHECGGYFTFGDLDADGTMDFATGGGRRGLEEHQR